MRVRYGQKWMLSALACVAILFMGFAIKGSDQPAVALMLMSLVTMLAALVWGGSVRFEPRYRRGLTVVLLSFCLFVLVLAYEFYVIISTEAANSGGIRDVSILYMEYLKLGGLSCAFILGFGLARRDVEGRRLLDMIMSAGGIWAFLCFFIYTFDVDMRANDVGTLTEGRLHGVFSSPNSAGTLFAALTVMSLVRLMSSVSNIENFRQIEVVLARLSSVMFAGLTMLFSLAALILTVSRGAMFAGVVVFVCIVIVYLWGRPAILRKMGVPFGIVGFATLFLTPVTHLFVRYQNSENDAWARFRLYYAHFELASRSPWFGFGLGSFNTLNNTLLTPQNYADLAIVRSAHNVYLQWYEDTGAVGLTTLVILNLAILLPIVRSMVRHTERRMPLLMVLAAYAVFLIHGTVDYAFQEPSLAIFICVILGCGLAIATNSSERARSISQTES